MAKYEEAMLEIVAFEAEDVITDSNPDWGEGHGED